MKFKTLSAIAAVALLIGGIQSAEARNNTKPGGGGGTPTPPNTSQRLLGQFTAQCNNPGDVADASFQNVSGIGQTVKLHTVNKGIASASVEGLNTSNVTMLGAIQFYSDVPADNLSVYINFTIPGGTVVPFEFNLAQGSLRKAAQPNLYFIPVNNANGNVQIQAGSRINVMTFNLVGKSNQDITERIYGLNFTGFGGVGYDLSSPSAFCGSD
ncbi:MAG: hypothetical protein JST89_16750 [Cyanobacteria bacterium SZAS-4]|nr:hypothetical protein [Cyanobacteria bacterium SZAS-4]